MNQLFSIFKPAIRVSFFLYVALTIISCKKSSGSSSGNNDTPPPDTVSYSGNLTKSSADVVTSATGTITGSFNPAKNELSYTFTWQGLSSKAIEMHIHDNGPIIIPITGFPMDTSGTWSGKATLTATQVADLQAGKLYGQIHTENYPAGEVLGVFSAGSQNGNPTPPPPYDPY